MKPTDTVPHAINEDCPPIAFALVGSVATSPTLPLLGVSPATHPRAGGTKILDEHLGLLQIASLRIIPIRERP